MNERLKFIASYQAGESSMSELCARFGVSRKTGYKILARYRAEGLDGLKDRPRAPRSHPNQTLREMEAEVLRVKRAHPTWGSKKIKGVLEKRRLEGVPARSTIDEIMRRAGLVQRRRKRRSSPPLRDMPDFVADRPNDAWSANFKGWFKLGDGKRCDPLTINDVLRSECRAKNIIVSAELVGAARAKIRAPLQTRLLQASRPR